MLQKRSLSHMNLWKKVVLTLRSIVFTQCSPKRSKARAKTVQPKLDLKLPLKRRHPISQQTLSSFFFSCSPKTRALPHFVRTGCEPFDTASAYLIYYAALGWPCFVHKLPSGARDTGIQGEAVLHLTNWRKLTSVFYASVHEFRHNIVKVAADPTGVIT